MNDLDSEVVDVAIPLPVQDPFSYHVPLDRMTMPPRGACVLVPFKNREILGYVVGKHVIGENPSVKTKAISALLENELVLSEEILKLTKRMSEYYCCSWGEAISNALPQLAKRKSPTRKRSIAISAHDQESAEAVCLHDGSLFCQESPLKLSKDQEKAVRLIE